MVSIIIPTLSEKSKPYLDLCIRSIENLDFPKDEIEVIISSPKGYAPQYDIAETYEHTGERDFAEAVNLGVRLSMPSSEYLLILSDDTILTKNSLKHLVRFAKDGDYILNATSNCDNYASYWLMFYAGDYAVTGRFFKLEDTDRIGITDQMINSESLYASGAIFTDAVCFYATLIPRKVWNKVGELDEDFKTGYEDTDYCVRARSLGIRCGIVLDALIWHFGGVTSEGYLTEEMKKMNKQTFDQKWSNKETK